MSDQESLQETVVWERQNRAVANVLGVADRIDMDPEDRRRLRGVVMREIGELTDLACALVRASADGQYVNEVYVEMLREVKEIHSAVVGNGSS